MLVVLLLNLMELGSFMTLVLLQVWTFLKLLSTSFHGLLIKYFINEIYEYRYWNINIKEVKQWNRTFVNQEPQRFQSINPWWLLNTNISYILIHISVFVMESNKYHWWLNYMNIYKKNKSSFCPVEIRAQSPIVNQGPQRFQSINPKVYYWLAQ